VAKLTAYWINAGRCHLFSIGVLDNEEMNCPGEWSGLLVGQLIGWMACQIELYYHEYEQALFVKLFTQVCFLFLDESGRIVTTTVQPDSELISVENPQATLLAEHGKPIVMKCNSTNTPSQSNSRVVYSDIMEWYKVRPDAKWG